MKIDKNDPRLTAYVLNELSAADKALIEDALKADSDLRNEVQLLRKSAGILQSLSTQPSHRLSPSQRDAIFPKAKSKIGWLSLSGGFAAAALAVIIFQRGPDNSAKVAVVSSDTVAVHQENKKPKAAAAEAPAVAAADTAATAETEALVAPPAPAKDEAIAQFEERSRETSYAAAAGSGSGAYAASAPRKKMFTSVKSGGAASARSESLGAAAMVAPRAAQAPAEVAPLGDVTLTQILPKAPAVVLANSQFQKCFSENLSKYVKYHLVFGFKFILQNGVISNLQITDPSGSQVLSVELQDCITNVVLNQTWPAVSTQFEFRLAFDSK
jgi:hypothetical protein